MSEAKTKKLGAPTKKTTKILEQICTGIASGKSARAMCLEVGIDQSTLWKWIAEDEIFSKQYARAKDLCADYYAEEIIEISDSSERDKYIDENGREVTDHEAVQRSRLRVDARKWYASKLAPKKYGDKVTNEIAGDPDKPLHQVITVSFIAPNAPK